MIARLPMGAAPPRAALERLIARHGVWAVLTGVMVALLRPRRKPAPRRRMPTTSRLSPHIRRDLGLQPYRPEEPPRYWNHY